LTSNKPKKLLETYEHSSLRSARIDGGRKRVKT